MNIIGNTCERFLPQRVQDALHDSVVPRFRTITSYYDRFTKPLETVDKNGWGYAFLEGTPIISSLFHLVQVNRLVRDYDKEKTLLGKHKVLFIDQNFLRLNGHTTLSGKGTLVLLGAALVTCVALCVFCTLFVVTGTPIYLYAHLIILFSFEISLVFNNFMLDALAKATYRDFVGSLPAGYPSQRICKDSVSVEEATKSFAAATHVRENLQKMILHTAQADAFKQTALLPKQWKILQNKVPPLNGQSLHPAEKLALDTYLSEPGRSFIDHALSHLGDPVGFSRSEMVQQNPAATNEFPQIVRLIQSGLNKLQSYEGVLFGCNTLSQEEQQALKPGDLFVPKGFISFRGSSPAAVASVYEAIYGEKTVSQEISPVFYVIDSKSAKFVEASQEEYLYPLGTSFKVRDIDMNHKLGLKIIYLEEAKTISPKSDPKDPHSSETTS